jgi:hypothetical protein
MAAYEMIITVDKGELLAKLRENRDKHQTVFQAALEGFRREAIRVLRNHISMMEGAGLGTLVKIGSLDVRLSRPEDHTRDYDRVIGMLEMDQGITFRLDQQTYRNYVDDDWTWKQSWSKLSLRYAPDSYTSNYGDDDDGDEW